MNKPRIIHLKLILPKEFNKLTPVLYIYIYMILIIQGATDHFSLKYCS